MSWTLDRETFIARFQIVSARSSLLYDQRMLYAAWTRQSTRLCQLFLGTKEANHRGRALIDDADFMKPRTGTVPASVLRDIDEKIWSMMTFSERTCTHGLEERRAAMQRTKEHLQERLQEIDRKSPAS